MSAGLLMITALANADSTFDMLKIEFGTYRPLYLDKNSPLIEVKSFYVDRLSVSNEEFYFFVKKNPQWSVENVPSIFAERDT